MHRASHMNEISAYLPGILLACSAFLLAIASPGPNILAIVGTSMGAGRRSGIALALGIAEDTARAGSRRGPSACFTRGLAVQMTNPKAAFTWVAIISLGLDESAPSWVAVSIIAGTTIRSVAIHVAYATLFSIPAMGRLYSKARRWIEGGLSAFFAFAGFKLLLGRA
jgi:threonine/homoserine/homoserine lactone efflux protein